MARALSFIKVEKEHTNYYYRANSGTNPMNKKEKETLK
jgi:hypothetical protein